MALKHSVAALKHRNFRLFWTGQCISLVGTWMQNIAQAWLVSELTKPHEAIWLGWVTAVQSLPIFLFSLFAGTLIDRFSKKKMLLFTQTVMLILALALFIDTWLHTAALWHVMVIAALLGCANTLDMPTRQAFMIELVGKEELTNAIVLNSTIFNIARIVGPAVAGLVIAKWGMDFCFFLNALSFIPVIAGIALIRLTDQAVPESGTGVLEEIAEGLRHAGRTPGIWVPLGMLAAVNVFAFNFQVLIPLYARNVFHGGAQDLGFLMSAFGFGSLAGAMILAARSSGKPQFRTLAAAAFAVCVLEIIVMPIRFYFPVIILLGLIGFALITFTTTTNSLIQMQAPNRLRGRIMSIYTWIFMGMSPIGSFGSGFVASCLGAPATLGLGGAVALGIVLLLTAGHMELFRGSISEKI